MTTLTRHIQSLAHAMGLYLSREGLRRAEEELARLGLAVVPTRGREFDAALERACKAAWDCGPPKSRDADPLGAPVRTPADLRAVMLEDMVAARDAEIVGLRDLSASWLAGWEAGREAAAGACGDVLNGAFDSDRDHAEDCCADAIRALTPPATAEPTDAQVERAAEAAWNLSDDEVGWRATVADPDMASAVDWARDEARIALRAALNPGDSNA